MPRLENLTARENEVWDLICSGLHTTAIAKRLSISEKTVETHRTHINKKLGTRSAGQVILRRIIDEATRADATADDRLAGVLMTARRALYGSAAEAIVGN